MTSVNLGYLGLIKSRHSGDEKSVNYILLKNCFQNRQIRKSTENQSSLNITEFEHIIIAFISEIRLCGKGEGRREYFSIYLETTGLIKHNY